MRENEKEIRKFERETQREERRRKAFAERLETPQGRERIRYIIETNGLANCKNMIRNSTLDRGKLKLVFEPTDEEFRRIISQTRPNIIYYNQINEDDGGPWGSLHIKFGEDVEIYSMQHIFGYESVFNLCEQLGYRDEREHSAFKNSRGKFVSGNP